MSLISYQNQQSLGGVFFGVAPVCGFEHQKEKHHFGDPLNKRERHPHFRQRPPDVPPPPRQKGPQPPSFSVPVPPSHSQPMGHMRGPAPEVNTKVPGPALAKKPIARASGLHWPSQNRSSGPLQAPGLPFGCPCSQPSNKSPELETPTSDVPLEVQCKPTNSWIACCFCPATVSLCSIEIMSENSINLTFQSPKRSKTFVSEGLSDLPKSQLNSGTWAGCVANPRPSEANDRWHLMSQSQMKPPKNVPRVRRFALTFPLVFLHS